MINQEWMSYLQQIGAQFEGAAISHFGESGLSLSQILQGEVITDLSQFGVIKVSGADAEKFLQGQFTNDVRQVKVTQSQLSAWCSPKGRIIVNFRLFKRDDQAYYLWLPRVNIETALKRLRGYVLRSKVVLEEVSESWLRLGVTGVNSTALLSAGLGHQIVPTTVDACMSLETITVLQIQGLTPRYVVLSNDLATMQRLWETMSQQARPVGSASWGLLDILAGVPQILPATTDKLVPQMVNYQTLGGVSFTKGCYPGQEVVARLQYLAELKRRMYLVRFDTTTLAVPGMEVYVANEEVSVGTLVNVEAHPDGGMIALAVLSISHSESQATFRLATGEPLVVVMPGGRWGPEFISLLKTE